MTKTDQFGAYYALCNAHTAGGESDFLSSFVSSWSEVIALDAIELTMQIEQIVENGAQLCWHNRAPVVSAI